MAGGLSAAYYHGNVVKGMLQGAIAGLVVAGIDSMFRAETGSAGSAGESATVQNDTAAPAAVQDGATGEVKVVEQKNNGAGGLESMAPETPAGAEGLRLGDLVKAGYKASQVLMKYASIAKVTSPKDAVLWAVDMGLNKIGIMLTMTKNASLATDIVCDCVGAGVSLAAQSYYTGAYGAIDCIRSIGNIPVYGTGQTTGQWWGNFFKRTFK